MRTLFIALVILACHSHVANCQDSTVSGFTFGTGVGLDLDFNADAAQARAVQPSTWVRLGWHLRSNVQFYAEGHVPAGQALLENCIYRPAILVGSRVSSQVNQGSWRLYLQGGGGVSWNLQSYAGKRIDRDFLVDRVGFVFNTARVGLGIESPAVLPLAGRLSIGADMVWHKRHSIDVAEPYVGVMLYLALNGILIKGR